MVRLGQRERANVALDWFLRDRRPTGFRHWAEVVDSTYRKPRFLGDMPHTWCGTDYVRSFVDLFAYTEGPGGAGGADSVLVLAAGVRADWVTAGKGTRVERLPTPFGPLSYRMSPSGQSVVVEIDAGVRIPPGGIRLRPPTGGPEQVVRTLPARILLPPR